MDNAFDICAQIDNFIDDLNVMQREMAAESDTAIDEAAAVIAAEQRRIFAKAHFERKKKRVYKYANDSLIRVTKKKLGRAKIKAYIGYAYAPRVPGAYSCGVWSSGEVGTALQGHG